MYCILLLRETEDEISHVKDYLRLGGCNIKEKQMSQIVSYDEILYDVDIILVDCNDINYGSRICAEIRGRTQIPIIVMSACDEEWAKIKIFQIGVDDYLVTPFYQGELIARVSAHIERFRQLSRPFGYIRTRDLEIDAFRRVVRLKGKEIFFRVKEFEILLYLAQNSDRVVTKEDIFATIWKEELGDGYYNCVSVQIKRIREKIETNMEDPQYIQTVWGAGYRFCK